MSRFSVALAAALLPAALTLTAAVAQTNTGGGIAPAVAPADGIIVSPSELQFVPIPPCRAFDTHASSPLAAARSFTISGTGNLTTQGGPRGGCGVPVWATAVAISLTTSSGDGAGYVAAYPAGHPATTTTAVSFNSTTNDTAGLSIAISSHQLTLKPYGGSAQVSGDVTGYYAPPISAIISPDGTVYSQSGRVVSTAHDGTGSYALTIDRDVSGCAASLNIQGGPYYGNAYVSGPYVMASTWSLNSSAAPVATDLYFNIAVHC